MIRVEIEQDSISARGERLVTFVCTYPRFIHAQLMTHRVFSRNAQSSRAVPTEKLIQSVLDNPVDPVEWGSNQRGMQAGPEVAEREKARAIWDSARGNAIFHAKKLAALGVHKQLVNRLLEPFAHITAIITATEWENFFLLRAEGIDPATGKRLPGDAQPEMRVLATQMRDRLEESVPVLFGTAGGRPGEDRQWHLPFIGRGPEDPALALPRRSQALISAARCARVSYLNHEGTLDVEKDLALAGRLMNDGHWSPFEHVATPWHAHNTNLKGWTQLRRILEIGADGFFF